MPEIEEAHLEHCVDVIRQRLMCTADASVVTFRWVKGLSTPYPNFHTGHMCRNYEGLLDWAQERKADMAKVDDWDYQYVPPFEFLASLHRDVVVLTTSLVTRRAKRSGRR